MIFKNKLCEKCLPVILLLGIYAGGCAVASYLAGIEEKAESKKEPVVLSSFNHMIHVASGFGCTDCHEGAEEEEKPGMPDISLCDGCHGDEPSEEYTEWADAEPKKDGGIQITGQKMEGFEDVIFPHNMHYYAELSCDFCHGDIGESEEIMENTILGKYFCMDCHGGDFGCSDCHREIRRTTEPKNHEGEFWRESHGKAAFPKPGEKNKRCHLCHSEEGCGKCHGETRPSSHGESWKRFHGTEVDISFELQENRCFFCHKRIECRTCHATEEPASHNASWRTRTHGLHAEMERNSCMVCHKQAYCAGCHKAAPPRPRDAAHPANADCGSCHGLLEHGFRSTENFECIKCHK